MIETQGSWAKPDAAFQAMHTAILAFDELRAPPSARAVFRFYWEQRHHFGFKDWDESEEHIGQLVCPARPYTARSVRMGKKWLLGHGFLVPGIQGRLIVAPAYLADSHRKKFSDKAPSPKSPRTPSVVGFIASPHGGDSVVSDHGSHGAIRTAKGRHGFTTARDAVLGLLRDLAPPGAS